MNSPSFIEQLRSAGLNDEAGDVDNAIFNFYHEVTEENLRRVNCMWAHACRRLNAVTPPSNDPNVNRQTQGAA